MKKNLISSLLAISMMITAVQPQITFAEDIEITSEQETEDVMETEVTEENLSDGENITEENSDEEITEETEAEDQSIEDSIVEEQILDESEIADPLQTYVEDNNEEKQSDFLYTVLDDGTAEITGYQGKTDGDLLIPNSIDGYTVTSIGENAFFHKTFHDKLILPETVEVIKEYAFAECGFTGSLAIPDGVTEIEREAFERNKFTGELKLPNSLEKIDDCAFMYSGFTGDLILPDSLKELGSVVFTDCNFNGKLVLPSGITEIGEATFKGCSFIGDLIIPEGVTEIGDGAFAAREDYSLASADIPVPENIINNEISVYGAEKVADPFTGKLVLPSTLKKIGWFAFAGCGLKENLTIPNGVTEIGVGAFEECAFTGDLNLADVNITEITQSAFSKCDFNGTLTLSSKISEIEDMAFFDCKFTGDLIVPDSLTNIGDGAFSSDGSGQFNGTLKLSENLVSIGKEAFSNCKFTGDLRIPSKVTEIGETAFSKGAFTGDIILPNSIMKIGENAFYKAHDRNSTGRFVLPVLSSGVHRYLFEDKYILDCATEMNAGQQIKGQVVTDSVYLDAPLVTGWSSSNEKIASVDNNGNIVAHAKGEVTIHVDLYNGRFCEKQIKVNPDKVIIRFDSAGGSSVADQTVAYKAKATIPAEPARKGYRFLGWYQNGQRYDFSTTLLQDITLTAKWEKLEVKVSAVLLNKNYLKLSKNQQSSLTVTVNPSDATNKSVVWTSTNPKVATVIDGKVQAKSVGETTIIAMTADGSGQFATCNVIVGCAIKYQLNGGKNHTSNPESFYKETVKLKNPTRVGYVFKGWYTDKKLKHKISKITSKTNKDVTVYAKWKKISIKKATITSLKSNKSGQAVVKYKSVKGAKGYQIVYSMDKKFENGKFITTGSRSVTLKGMSKKKMCYVKVRAYTTDSAGRKVYGAYSSTKKVKLK